MLALLPALLFAGEAAPAREPTADEVVLLCLINEHRVHPRLGDLRIVAAIKAGQTQIAAHLLRWEWSKNATVTGSYPPVVINPRLCAAATVLLQAGAKPNEKTRFDAAPALRTAGYPAEGENLTMFSADRPSLLAAYADAFTTCVGETPSKHLISAGFDAVKGDWREAGVAVTVANGRFRVVVILARGTAKRHLGGVVYADGNRNQSYDPGEGRAGVKVVCGKEEMITGASGAWWLATDTPDQTEVVFHGNGGTYSSLIAGDGANVMVDCRVPDPADLRTVDHLIVAAEAAQRGTDAQRATAASAALLVGIRMPVLDDARRRKAEALIAPVRDDFAATLQRVLAILAEEPAAFARRLAELRRPWGSAMSDWFKEVEGLYVLRRQVQAVLAAPAGQQQQQARQLLGQLTKCREKTRDPAFLGQYQEWSGSLGAILADESAKPPAKDGR